MRGGGVPVSLRHGSDEAGIGLVAIIDEAVIAGPGAPRIPDGSGQGGELAHETGIGGGSGRVGHGQIERGDPNRLASEAVGASHRRPGVGNGEVERDRVGDAGGHQHRFGRGE